MLAAWQALDLFHAAQELAAGLVRRLDSYRLGDLEQFLNGNIERDGEACSARALSGLRGASGNVL